LRRIAADFRPDLVSALFLPDYGWMAAMAGLHPLAVSAWGSDLLVGPDRSILRRRRVSYVLSRADHLFADAEILRDKMREYGAPPERITIVPLGVDHKWLAVGENRRDTVKQPLRVITNRKQEPLYRVGTVIKAATKVADSSEGRFRFVVLGEGSRHEDLVRLARQSLGEDVMIFKPWLRPDELMEEFACADVYVSASSSDGTSVSLLEAMAAGCLPIVTDLPANREWIEPGINGLLFPVGDADALANALRQAAADRPLRLSARTRNLEIVKARALWQDNMAHVEETMAEIVTRSRNSAVRQGRHG
jgi:glycosyltransferase involved in cell wall biosynthesis